MKAIIEFDLNDPEDRMKHMQCVKAESMAIVLFEITHNLKKQFLAECEGDGVEVPDGLIDMALQMIQNLLYDYSINTEELCM